MNDPLFNKSQDERSSSVSLCSFFHSVSFVSTAGVAQKRSQDESGAVLHFFCQVIGLRDAAQIEDLQLLREGQARDGEVLDEAMVYSWFS